LHFVQLSLLVGAAQEIHAALFQRCLEHVGVRGDEVDGRDHVEQLARDEGDDLLVMRRNATDAGRDVMPPLLVEQEALVDDVERPVLPCRVAKAPPSFPRPGSPRFRVSRLAAAQHPACATAHATGARTCTLTSS